MACRPQPVDNLRDVFKITQKTCPYFEIYGVSICFREIFVLNLRGKKITKGSG
jgi:hypothetical protein